MLIEYDGRPFSGWQIQHDRPSVQQAIEHALEVVWKVRPNVTGSGRTDAGVHARGQVARFDVDEPVDAARLRRSLNGVLPGSAAVLALENKRHELHARASAPARGCREYATAVTT